MRETEKRYSVVGRVYIYMYTSNSLLCFLSLSFFFLSVPFPVCGVCLLISVYTCTTSTLFLLFFPRKTQKNINSVPTQLLTALKKLAKIWKLVLVFKTRMDGLKKKKGGGGIERQYFQLRRILSPFAGRDQEILNSYIIHTIILLLLTFHIEGRAIQVRKCSH